MTKALNLSFWAFYKKAKNPYFKSAIRTLNLRLNLNSTYSANCGKWILRYRSVWQANLAFVALVSALLSWLFRRAGSLFACRKRLIANSVPNLPFVCQANSKTIKIIAQKISFAEKICKFFQARAQNKAKKSASKHWKYRLGGGDLYFCEILEKFLESFEIF